MFSESESNKQALDIVVYGILTGIGLAVGAAIVAILFRLMGIRWAAQ